MKKVIALVAAAAFVLSMATMASAAHQGRHTLETGGMFQSGIMYTDNENFSDEEGQDQSQLEAHSRLRQYFDYIASENLKATVGYEVDAVWGSEKAPAGADAGDGDADFLELKRANMEFTLPNTETTVKAGLQWVELPSVALGSNPVLGADAPGAIVSTPVSDMADLTFGWVRADNNEDNITQAGSFNGTSSSSQKPGVDSFLAALPMSQDGYTVSPFGVYTVIGEDSRSGTYGDLNDDASMYHLGATFDADIFDPVGMRAGFIYGSLSADEDENDQSGWYADLAFDYAMDGMTPEIYGMYASGNDDEDDGSERMPTIANDSLTSPYPSMLLGDATYLGITDDDAAAGVGLLSFNPMGMWTVGAKIKDIALSEKLSGTLQVGYYQGTNDEDAPNNAAETFTSEDSAYEVTVATNYQVYEQLSAICEAGYAALDLEENINGRGDDPADEPATKFGVGLVYSF